MGFLHYISFFSDSERFFSRAELRFSRTRALSSFPIERTEFSFIHLVNTLYDHWWRHKTSVMTSSQCIEITMTSSVLATASVYSCHISSLWRHSYPCFGLSRWNSEADVRSQRQMRLRVQRSLGSRVRFAGEHLRLRYQQSSSTGKKRSIRILKRRQRVDRGEERGKREGWKWSRREREG